MKSYGRTAAVARASGTRRTPARPVSSNSLARAAMAPVASGSAGPPCGGVDLKPPSRGGGGAGGSAGRRVVLEAAVARGVVRRGHHDAVGGARSVCRAAVGGEDRV